MHSVQSIRAQVPTECYATLHSDRHSAKDDDHHHVTFYSFLYHLDIMHKANDFSGVLIERRQRTSAHRRVLLLKSRAEELLSPTNVYKCTYKHDLTTAATGIRNPLHAYEETFCVFGHELNNYEAPRVQSLFSSTSYMASMLRHALYGSLAPVVYRQASVDEPDTIPNVVHMIWFGDAHKTLKFVEYLSVKSVLGVLRPNVLKIHGDHMPSSSCPLWRQIVAHPRVTWVNISRPLLKYGQNFSASPIQHLADIGTFNT